MTVVRITRDPPRPEFWGTTAGVRFSYDPELVDMIRTIRGRRWEPEGKVWRIPEEEIAATAAMFIEVGATVFVDGQLWHAARDNRRKPPHEEPPPRAKSKAGGNPFTTFLNALPARYRMPAWKALQKVMHPDVGGDHDLSQQLNDARPEKVA